MELLIGLAVVVLIFGRYLYLSDDPILIKILFLVVGGSVILSFVIGFVRGITGSFDAQSNVSPLATPTPQLDKIIFAGKVVNHETSKWPNDRLVLVYLHGKEIGRAISATGEFSENKLGVLDGIFVIPVDNTYKLTTSNFEVAKDIKPTTELSLTMVSPLKVISAVAVPLQENEKAKLQFTTGTNSEGIYHWFELEEGNQIEIRVPSKNLSYVVKSIAGDKATLPPQLLTVNSTRLNEHNEIVVSLSNNNTSEPQNLSTENIPTIGDLRYTDIQTKTVILRKISQPVENCVSSRLTTVFSDTRTIVHQYQVEVGGEIGAEVTLPIPVIQVQLFAALQAKYGFEQGQLETRTIAYRIEVEPHTNQVYDFTWKEVWEYGTAQTVNGEITIPFEVKTDLIYDIDSKDLGCN